MGLIPVLQHKVTNYIATPLEELLKFINGSIQHFDWLPIQQLFGNCGESDFES